MPAAKKTTRRRTTKESQKLLTVEEARKRLSKALDMKESDIAVASRQINLEGDIFTKEIISQASILTPPYDPFRLTVIAESNSILPQCIEAMVRNIDGFGYELQYKGEMGKENEPAALKEKGELEGFLNQVNEHQSFMSVRKQAREDVEKFGFGFMEVVRDAEGKLSLIYYVDARYMRLQALQSDQVEITVSLNRGGKAIPVKIMKRFRRFVMYSTAVSSKIKYFKEYGDPRTMDAITGKYENEKGYKFTEEATEILHIKIGNDTYGIPRWSGIMSTVLGSTSADYVNYDLFENQVVPPLAILVSGGKLTAESVDDIAKVLVKKRGVKNFNKVLILEAQSEGNIDEKDRTKIELKELSQARKEDSMFNEYLKLADIRVRSAFRLPPLYVGRCVPVDTEFLTENGWIPFSDITQEAIATVNAEGTLEYQTPSARHEYDYSGNLMILNNTRSIDFMGTENHRMFISTNGSPWRFREFSELPGWHTKFLQASIVWEGAEISSFTIPFVENRNSVDLSKSKNTSRDLERVGNDLNRYHAIAKVDMDLFLESIGYYVSEGSLSQIGHSLNLSQNSGPVADRMLFVLGSLRFLPYTGIYRENQEVIGFSDRHVISWVRENCGAHCDNKKFPRWFLDLSRRQLKILFDALMDGDGSTCDVRSRKGSGSFYTTSKVLADLMQELCFKLGFRSTATWKERTEEGENWKDICQITISSVPTNHCLELAPMISSERYEGRVGCFTVKNGTIVTRRNGRVLVSGNSEVYSKSTSDSSKMIGEEQIFVPERAEFDEYVNLTLMIDLKAQNWKFKSRSPRLISGEDIIEAVDAFSKMGAVTINDTIKIANNILGRDIQEYEQAWAKYPIPIVLELAKQGALDGIDELINITSLTARALESPGNGEEKNEQKAAIVVAMRSLRKALIQHRA